jgi:hypothetical protein
MEARQRIEQIKKRLNKSEDEDYDHREVWLYWMLSFGWIPYNEFLELDAELGNYITSRLNEIKKKEQEVNKRGIK